MPLTVYLKPTDRCNLKCLHCYIPERNKKNSRFLSIEDIKTIAGKFGDLAKHIYDSSILVVWHGGECTLAGKEFFVKAKEIFDSYRDGYEIRHSIQTNIIAVDKSWIEIIKDMFSGVVGTSFDPDIRLYNGSHSKFREKWFKNYEMLRENDIHINVNITVVKPLVMKGVDNFFALLDELGAREYHIERFTPRGEGLRNSKIFYLNDYEYYSFLIEIAKRYFRELSEGKINYLLNPLDALYLTKDRGVGCWCGDCMSVALTINPDGTVSSCPDLAVDSRSIFGNILKDDVQKILTSQKRVKLIANQRNFVCDCEHIIICNGGCPLHFYGGDKKTCKEFFKTIKEIQEEYGDRITTILTNMRGGS